MRLLSSCSESRSTNTSPSSCRCLDWCRAWGWLGLGLGSALATGCSRTHSFWVVRGTGFEYIPLRGQCLSVGERHLEKTATYKFQQLDNRFAWCRSNMQPVTYPVHTPLDSFVFLPALYERFIDSQGLRRLPLASLSFVYGDEMEYTIVAGAMHGKSESDGHSWRRA